MQLISCAVILLHYELGYLVCMLPVTRSDTDVSVIQYAFSYLIHEQKVRAGGNCNIYYQLIGAGVACQAKTRT